MWTDTQDSVDAVCFIIEVFGITCHQCLLNGFGHMDRGDSIVIQFSEEFSIGSEECGTAVSLQDFIGSSGEESIGTDRNLT